MLTAIALKRKVDGGDSADVAESMNVLAELYARRGELEKAIDMTDQARAIYDREYGPDGIMSGRGYNNRCEYLSTLGRHGEALDSCQKALAIWEAALGTDHVWLGYALTGIGVALTGLHRPREALAPLRRALDIRKRREAMAAARAETWFALARARVGRRRGPRGRPRRGSHRPRRVHDGARRRSEGARRRRLAGRARRTRGALTPTAPLIPERSRGACRTRRARRTAARPPAPTAANSQNDRAAGSCVSEIAETKTLPTVTVSSQRPMIVDFIRRGAWL